MGTQKKHVQIYAEQVFGEFLSRVPQAEAEVNFMYKSRTYATFLHCQLNTVKDF